MLFVSVIFKIFYAVLNLSTREWFRKHWQGILVLCEIIPFLSVLRAPKRVSQPGAVRFHPHHDDSKCSP
jgi:hypothetical protein